MAEDRKNSIGDFHGEIDQKRVQNLQSDHIGSGLSANSGSPLADVGHRLDEWGG